MTGLAVLSLLGPAAHDLVAGDAALLAALDAAHAAGSADVLLLGGDDEEGRRLEPGVVRGGIDPVTTAIAWHTRFPSWGVLAVAAPERDHPYNLARRVLGAAHLTGDRVGVLLTDGATPWQSTPAVTADAATAIRALWGSWPAGTIVGDRETGRYADVSGVRAIDHDGAWRIAGPLGTPGSAGGDPVLGSWRRDTAWADVVVRDGALLVAGTIAGVVHDVRTASDVAAVPRRRRTSAPGRSASLREILGLPAPDREPQLEGQARG